ncbi:hypothetical protein OG948_32995 [Embleya sp. NBC_00888]|uniref:hypothetical protein n=1 Tax=Embleya sp. NBC_00888 TaxID=2975960 RepID=UPI0038674B0D|nr:hypothetical protein OG948_32995 [Embleya sp. NBC_00888]
MANALSDHLRGRKLVGRAWIESDERFRIEYRRMRRRVPMYRVAIGALRLLHRLTATERQKQADLGVTWWPRVGPDGEMYAMPKLWTIDEREPTDKQTPGPPRTEAELYRRWEAGEWSEPKNGAETRTTGSPAELRRVASFAARLARTVSGDEWPQIIHEYERRKAILAQLRAGVVPEGNRYVESGAVPPGVRPPLHGWARYQWVGDRPLDLVSDRLMDRSWVLGRTPARQYQPWSAGRVAYPGAYFGPMFGELGRTVVGGEANPEFLSLRVAYGVWWGQNASMKGEARILRGARMVRLRDLARFAHAEAAHLGLAPAPRKAPSAAPRWENPAPEEVTDEVVTAVARFARSAVPTDAVAPVEPSTGRPSTRSAAAEVAAEAGAQAPTPAQVWMDMPRPYDRSLRADGALSAATIAAITAGWAKQVPSRGLPGMDPGPGSRPLGVHPWRPTPARDARETDRGRSDERER